MPVVFITDALVFLLVLIAIVFIFYVRQHEHLSRPWREVSQKPLAMGSVVVLFFYIVIGLLDCVHYHPKLKDSDTEYSTEIISLLDHFTEHLRNSVEKTYSAPFAIQAFAKESIEIAPGKTIRDYPRLQYGGNHLDNSGEDRLLDILSKTLFALSLGFLFWLLISSGIILWLCRAQQSSFKYFLGDVVHNRTDIPWRVFFLTLAVMTTALFWAIYLSHYYHILGTDKVGQDVFYQALKSIRTGLVIGTLTTLVMLPFALLLGIMAGYFRGWIDDVIQYLYTTLNSIPGVLLIAAAILMLEVYMTNHAEDFTSTAHRSDLRLFFLCVILGITNWTGLCRLLRGEVMKLREIDYVQAAHAFGVSHFTIMMRHLLPNVMHIVMISIVIDFSALVLAEAVLAYINIGVDPTMSSWGNMINSARLEMAREPVVWWSLFAAFIFMLGLVLPANLFADAVRDAFDPRIRETR